MKKRRFMTKLLMIFLCICFCGLTIVLGLNTYVKQSGDGRILSVEEAAELTEVDCILVLGCKVKSDGTPSAMLEDRLIQGVALYEAGASDRLLMSGDHGSEEYNEVGAMKAYATDHGVSSSAVFMDHAGFSTYESVYRAKEIFGADKVIIVSQEYHLYRALYIAEALGVEAYGVSADLRPYMNQTGREVREILARCKDVATAMFQPEPTRLGEPISLAGDGNVTNDT